jgi:hypothetical protein
LAGGILSVSHLSEKMNLLNSVSKSEMEISIKIQENQMKQHNGVDENKFDIKETPVVKIDKSLLPKKETAKKAKGIRV